MRDEKCKTFQVRDKLLTNDGKIETTLNTSITVNVDPTLMSLDSDAILMTFLIKGKDIRTRARKIGDVSVDAIFDIQIEIPRTQGTTRRVAPETTVTMTK